MRSTPRNPGRRGRGRVAASLIAAAALFASAAGARAGFYQQNDLVTDDSVFLAKLGYPATTQPDDPLLINPWGMGFSATSPIWVSDNGSGVTTIYNGAGAKVTLNIGGTLVPQVTIATPPGQTPGTAAPTGQVFNSSGSGFSVSAGGVSGSSRFIFATEDGTISGWAPNVDKSNSILVPGIGGSGAVYKGLAMGTSGGQALLYAANFRAGTVEVYDSNFHLVNTITDPTPPPLPPGTPPGQNWAPFNVAVLNGKLYVTFALQNGAQHDDVAGPGNGFVDVFNLDGTHMQRLINTGSGDPLNSPWALDIAPGHFGAFSDDLLVGNFGNGEINVFDPTTGAFLGDLTDAQGNPIVIGDLWGLANGTGATVNGGFSNPDAVYFTAGVFEESHGLFGDLTFVPEPAPLALIGSGLLGLFWSLRRRRGRTGGARGRV